MSDLDNGTADSAGGEAFGNEQSRFLKEYRKGAGIVCVSPLEADREALKAKLSDFTLAAKIYFLRNSACVSWRLFNFCLIC